MPTENTAHAIDYVLQARAALAGIERLTDEIERAVNAAPMCREKWRDYGAALLSQRHQTTNDREFNQWIVANGLNTGRAENRGVRADAMWLAEQWTSVLTAYTGNHHRPEHIRQACRDAGLAWAGDTDFQRNRRANSRRTQAAARRTESPAPRTASTTRTPPPTGRGALNIMQENGLLSRNAGANRATVRARVVAEAQLPESCMQGELPTEHEMAFRAAAERLRDRRDATNASAEYTAARNDCPETMRDKYERAIERATAALRAGFRAQVDVEVERIVGERQRILDEKQSALEAMEARLIDTRRDLTQYMTEDEFRLVQNCLHPDRAPEDRRERFNTAFGIFRRLEAYIPQLDRATLRERGWSPRR